MPPLPIPLSLHSLPFPRLSHLRSSHRYLSTHLPHRQASTLVSATHTTTPPAPPKPASAPQPPSLPPSTTQPQPHPSTSPPSTNPAPPFPPLPYHVHRTASHKLPIYHLAKNGGNLHQTRIRKIEGDVDRLRDEIQRALGLREELVRINRLNGHIIVKGWYRDVIKKFLEDRQF